MKVELELTEQQLKELDNGLNNLLQNLSENQKLEIVKTYMLKQFEGIYKENTTSWGYSTSKGLSDFGQALIENLKSKISEATSERIIKELIKNDDINRRIKEVEMDLPKIIEKSISQYIINNLFESKDTVQRQMNEEITRWHLEHNSNNYN